MSLPEAATLIRLGLTLTCIWALVVFLWRRHAAEKFRQETFAIRDALFDLAAKEGATSEIYYAEIRKTQQSDPVRTSDQLPTSARV